MFHRFPWRGVRPPPPRLHHLHFPLKNRQTENKANKYSVKRYYRLMKTHEINNSGDTTTSSTPTGSTNTTPKKKMNGKRKATDPETETESKRKASKKGKKDQAVESAEKVVKKADLGIIEDEDEDADMEGETLTRIKDESEDSG